MLAVVATRLPVDLALTLSPLRWGGARDPSVRIGPDGVWRATRYPSGPATVHLRSMTPRQVAVRAWGTGAPEALAAAAALLGASDDDGGLGGSTHPVVRSLARRLGGLRISRSANPMEALVPTILGQKVQGASARASFCAMVRAAGARAPGAGDDAPRLLLPPPPSWLEAQPPWAWHRWGVEAKRARTIRVAASYAHRIAEAVSMTPAAASDRLQALPGVGPWSAAEVAMVAFGDPDAVSVGDYWLAHWVCFALAGEARGTDARMLELLAPWAGQRGRVCRLIMSGGSPPPRFGPRLPLAPITGL